MTMGVYCTCHVERLLLGVDIDRVQEVLYDRTVTPVPLADPSVSGLINLRGRIVTAIDARTRLGLTPRSAGQRTAHMIIRVGEETVSLVVDAAGEVVDVAGRYLDQVPPTVAPDLAVFLGGAYRLAGALMLVLDTDRVAAVPAGKAEPCKPWS